MTAAACASPIAGLLGEEAAEPAVVEFEPAADAAVTVGEAGATGESAQSAGVMGTRSAKASALTGSPEAEQVTEPMVAAIQAIIESEGVFRAPKTSGCLVADV